jgi:hypothetical protein
MPWSWFEAFTPIHPLLLSVEANLELNGVGMRSACRLVVHLDFSGKVRPEILGRIENHCFHFSILQRIAAVKDIKVRYIEIVKSRLLQSLLQRL